MDAENKKLKAPTKEAGDALRELIKLNKTRGGTPTSNGSSSSRSRDKSTSGSSPPGHADTPSGLLTASEYAKEETQDRICQLIKILELECPHGSCPRKLTPGFKYRYAAEYVFAANPNL